MLPKSALELRIVDGKLIPTWLTEADEPFSADVLDVLRELDGRSALEANATARALLAPIARRHGFSPRVADALWTVEGRRWESRIDAPIDPELLRDVVFELAAKLPHEHAIREAAQRVGIAEDAVRLWLFADRKNRRVLVAPKEPTTAKDLVLRYNLAVAQTLLLRAMDVEATVCGDVERIATVAKREGLIASFVPLGDATRIELSGPMAILHETSKYGRGLARFVPALVATKRWSLRARIFLEAEQAAWLELDSKGPIGFAQTLPGSLDGRIARMLARVLKKTRSGLAIELDTPVLRIDDVVIVPDFALVGERGRVLVDVIPFATEEFLARKVEAARRAPLPMLLCVDARYVPPPKPNTPEDVVVLRYRGAIDPFAILTAADRVLLWSSSSMPLVPSVASSSPSSPPSASSTWVSARAPPLCP